MAILVHDAKQALEFSYRDHRNTYAVPDMLIVFSYIHLIKTSQQTGNDHRTAKYFHLSKCVCGVKRTEGRQEVINESRDKWN